MKSIYEEKFRLREADFDRFDRITPFALLEISQEVAGKHAADFHTGYEDAKKNNLIWVLLRIRYEFLLNPNHHSYLNVKTWPRKKGRVDFDRDTLITDEKGNIVCKMQSKWAVVDGIKRTLVLPRNYNYPFSDFLEEATFDTPFEKLENFDVSSLKGEDIKTQYMDIDHNGHINNVNYVRYALNMLKLQEGRYISNLEINYIYELKENEPLTIYMKKQDNEYYFKGVSGDKVIFLLKINIK